MNYKYVVIELRPEQDILVGIFESLEEAREVCQKYNAKGDFTYKVTGPYL